jgi:membrane protein
MRSRALTLARETVLGWWQDGAPRLGAALAYYTIFSLAPLLLLSIGIAGLVFGEEAARGSIVAQLGGLLGPEAASAIETMVEKAGAQEGRSLGAGALAFATILFGASGAFAQLQTALNEIWDVEPAEKTRGVWAVLRRRLLSFGMVLVIGFLLLVSLVIAAAIAALDELIGARAELLAPLLGAVRFAVSLGLETLLFAAIFKLLPDRDIPWRNVWIGAFATSLLFEVGKWGIGLYLGNAAIGSMYGAAGSLVIVLVWVYYSAQILFLGAEFTQVWSQRRAPARAEA